MNDGTRPITVLISAIGGEGGGVLMSWIVNAAIAQGLPVQSTSVPGVAQRTGATTYYIELFPVPINELGGREPVLSLYPIIGDVDLVVASELIEIGRMMERGFVNPDRSTLIGSTHRVYSIAEKMVGTDGRYDSDLVLNAAAKMAKHTILFDFERVAHENDTVLNALLLGTIAGSGLLPIERTSFEGAIRTEGKAVESNLAGFSIGLAYCQVEMNEVNQPQNEATEAKTTPVIQKTKSPRQDLNDRAFHDYPETSHAILREGISRLIDYQGTAYAKLYMDRLDTILAVAENNSKLTSEAGRFLALWMSYEDVFRVAQLKTHRERFNRIRTEVGAKPGQVVKLTDYLKPGLEELCSIIPSFLARPLLSWAEKNNLMDRLQLSMHVKTNSIYGFLSLRLMAKLKFLRRSGYRFKVEQEMIENWLDLVRRAAALDQRLALEVTKCANLIKGYGDTRRGGMNHFRRIIEDIVEPALAGDIALNSAIDTVAKSLQAALANPEG